MEIRTAVADDWPRIWPFLYEVVTAGQTFTYPRDLSERGARALWMLDPPGRTVVLAHEGNVLGTAKMNPNQGGGGAHVASASFMVDPVARGRGVGRLLGSYALDWARTEGYRGMQFNAVVSSNTAAVSLWRSLGFDVVGTIPEGFAHPDDGYVDLLVMYRSLLD